LNDIGVKTGFGGPGQTFAERIAAQNQQRTINELRQAGGKVASPEQARALSAMQTDLAAGLLINKKDIEDFRKAAEIEATRIAKVYDDMRQRLSAGTTDASTKFKA